MSKRLKQILRKVFSLECGVNNGVNDPYHKTTTPLDELIEKHAPTSDTSDGDEQNEETLTCVVSEEIRELFAQNECLPCVKNKPVSGADFDKEEPIIPFLSEEIPTEESFKSIGMIVSKKKR